MYVLILCHLKTGAYNPTHSAVQQQPQKDLLQAPTAAEVAFKLWECSNFGTIHLPVHALKAKLYWYLEARLFPKIINFCLFHE